MKKVVLSLFIICNLFNASAITWVVIIENSQYQALPSIGTLPQEVTLLKQSLSNYQIDKILHKENLTLDQMRNFFRVELRNQIAANNVSELVIWYSGHGKSINQTSYWIPVDGTREDELTYYDFSELQRSLATFSNYLKHTLIVSDAGELNNTFFYAMRSLLPTCNSKEVREQTSSQVLANGVGTGATPSTLVESFAKILSENKGCMTIDEIHANLRTLTSNVNSKPPTLGTLDKLPNNGGSFVFVHK